MKKTVIKYSHTELILHEKLSFFTASTLKKKTDIYKVFSSKYLEITGSLDNLLDVSIHTYPLSPTFISCRGIVTKTFFCKTIFCLNKDCQYISSLHFKLI